MRRYVSRDITGLRCHMLVALELVEERKGKRDWVRLWRCRCDCGNEPGMVFKRLQQGWSIEDAITRPRRNYPEVRCSPRSA